MRSVVSIGPLLLGYGSSPIAILIIGIEDRCSVMAYCYWTGLSPVLVSGLGMTVWGNNQYSDRSPTAVSAFGESVAVRHSALGAIY